MLSDIRGNMNRKISFFISAFALSGVMAVTLRSLDFSKPDKVVSPALASSVAAVLPELKKVVVQPLEQLFISTAEAEGATPASAAVVSKPGRPPEIRVRAVRNGKDYGWVQLPRGTTVNLVRDEGSTMLVRFEEVTLRVTRSQVDAGLIVPVSPAGRGGKRLAGL